MSLITEIYKPMMTVGQVYARPFGIAAAPRMPIGNVLALELSHEEDVKKQQNFSRLGGGTHAQVRRVKSVGGKLTMADLNLVNLTRSLFGTALDVEAGTVTDEAVVAHLGGLIRLAHIQPSAVTLKKAEVAIPAAGNYEVRPEGIYVLPNAVGITDADPLTAGYTYGAYAAIEALTTSAPELELSFGGLNEAQSGKPVVVDVWRVAPGIVKTLALISDNFMGLPVEFESLLDPTKVGVGISRFYRVQMA